MTTDESKQTDQLEQSLIDIAVESWRFCRLFARVVDKLDAGEAGRYVNQLRYFQKKLEESLDASGLKLVNVEGQPFDIGMAASALNIGDFEPDDVLFVDQMVEPIIMGVEGLKKQGTVMLRKVHA
jgi:molecular chaperone GrpE (heat shock protein)